MSKSQHFINQPHPLTQLDGKMNTFTRRKLNIFDPKEEEISIMDIAHGLAFKPHFAGQTPFFFSIAQHSVLVYRLLAIDHPDTDLQLAALLHDAAEAYVGDMIKPIKVRLAEWNIIENRVQQAIFHKYNLPIGLMKLVKDYDLKAQELEYDCFYKDTRPLTRLAPEQSLLEFYETFLRITNQ